MKHACPFPGKPLFCRMSRIDLVANELLVIQDGPKVKLGRK